MAEGFRRAGIHFDLVFDYDPDACDSYMRNLGARPIQMDVRDLVRMARAGWTPEVGLLVADPPCTPWSRAGKRLGTEDERDMLEETAELVQLLRPRAYLIGNVPGLQDSTSWHVVQRVIGGLSRHGYCVADYAQLDAADYGVPQHRIRPFWFGHLDGPCVRWPAPTHGDPSHPALPGLALRSWVTCRMALSHLPAEDLGRPVRLRWKDGFEGPDHRPTTPDEPAATITRNTHSDGSLLVSERHPISTPDAPAYGVRAGRANSGAQGGKVLAVVEREPDRLRPPETGDDPSRAVTTQAGANHLLEWPWDRPATTVCKDPRIPPPGHHDSGSFMSPSESKGAKKKRPPSTKGPQWSRASDADAPAPAVLTDTPGASKSSPKLAWPWNRPSTTVCAGIDKIAPAGEHAAQFGPNAIVLSERAAAILQGFPTGWNFCGKTKKTRWSQIGMAMLPPLAEAVARSICAAVQDLGAHASGAEHEHAQADGQEGAAVLRAGGDS